MKEDRKDRLSDEQIKDILRAEDSIIMKGGRTLLAKILKGNIYKHFIVKDRLGEFKKGALHNDQ